MREKRPNFPALIITIIMYGIIAYFAYSRKSVTISNGEQLVSAIFSVKGAILLLSPLIISFVLAIINNDLFVIGNIVATVVACMIYIAEKKICFGGIGYIIYAGGSFIFAVLSSLIPGEPAQPKTFEEEQAESWSSII